MRPQHMLDLPRRVLRTELPIVELLVRTNKQTNKIKKNKTKSKTKLNKQNSHYIIKQHPIFVN